MNTQHDETSATASYSDTNKHTLKVWDLPTRIFHWLLVVLVVSAFTSANIGGTVMGFHKTCGVTILVLLVFRIIWGFVGSRESQFSAFIHGPQEVLRYARSMLQPGSRRHLGHNPLGGWSVLAMLTLLLVQAGTGLFANDDILTEGPLYSMVGKALSDRLTGIHEMNSAGLAVLIILHICAIGFYYLIKKDNLVLPMITGDKKWPHYYPPASQSLWIAIVVGVLSVVLVYGLISMAG